MRRIIFRTTDIRVAIHIDRSPLWTTAPGIPPSSAGNVHCTEKVSSTRSNEGNPPTNATSTIAFKNITSHNATTAHSGNTISPLRH